MTKKTTSPKPLQAAHAPLPDLYTTDEVAKMLRITPEKLKTMRRKGEGPRPIPVGSKTIRYRMRAIEEYFTAKEATGVYTWSHSVPHDDSDDE
ncbi:MAG TPA: helix-turn-helix domain-containing protein [Bryobacterales bacterium]|nr:helix-turn-helix domain-containing protein [Bryobacterales bacterium]